MHTREIGLEQTDIAVYGKLGNGFLKDLRDNGTLYHYHIIGDKDPDNEVDFFEQQGLCFFLNKAMMSDKFLDEKYILVTDYGAVIDHCHFVNNEGITIRYGDYIERALSPQAILKLKYTTNDDGQRVLECYNDVMYPDCKSWPVYMGIIAIQNTSFKIPERYNEEIEKIFIDKYPNLFKFIKDRFNDDYIELHIKYLDKVSDQDKA